MRRRSLLTPLVLLAVTPFASASPISYRLSGRVTESITHGLAGNPIAPSVVTLEYAVGTPIDLIFSYDPAAPRLLASGDGSADYELPYTVSGQIGARRFSADSGVLSVSDSDRLGDSLRFSVFSRNPPSGATPSVITESNPFTGSGYALSSFGFNLGRTDGGAFTGTSLPSSLDASLLQQSGLGFTYSDTVTGRFVTVRGSMQSIAAVPEPATLAALGLGVATLLRRRRSRP